MNEAILAFHRHVAFFLIRSYIPVLIMQIHALADRAHSIDRSRTQRKAVSGPIFSRGEEVKNTLSMKSSQAYSI